MKAYTESEHNAAMDRLAADLSAKGAQIAEMDPWDYAALWGDETPDGALFYNASSEKQPKTRAYLGNLIGAIDRLLADITKRPKFYGATDLSEVRQLRDWVETQYVAAN